LVTFEAQQHVPFPLNEVVWDYELIEGAADKEVVIVAIKSDALDEINGAVNDCGLGTAEVDVAPMALYNAFRSTYGHPEEPILLIDIGAKTSNLLYIEGKRFFTRSIAIGGSAITAAIAKEYNIPSWKPSTRRSPTASSPSAAAIPSSWTKPWPRWPW
jgi:type IV pilus assembly protein PilM